MRRAGPRCMTSRINDKRPVSSIIRQFTQNTVKVCFTLKTMTHYFSGKIIFRETSFRESSFRESDFPGNVRKPNLLLLSYNFVIRLRARDSTLPDNCLGLWLKLLTLARRRDTRNVFQRLLFKDIVLTRTLSYIRCNVLRFVNYIINLWWWW